MRSTFSILYYIYRGKVKADGTTAIMCRITIDGKNSVFATGCYCNPKDWKAKTGEVRDARTNNLLEALRSRIETSYDNLLKDAGMVTAEMLKNEITCVTTVPVTLLKAGEEERERLRIRSEVINSTSSYRQSKSSQAYLHEYLLSLGMRDIAFEDITEDFGWGYKLYLKSKDCGAGHINHCLTWQNRLWYCIHEIGILAGVKENLSYHASRHSFGTLTLSAGVPIESISKMMGYTNIRTTQGYAKMTDDKISEDMDKLMERRSKKGADSN